MQMVYIYIRNLHASEEMSMLCQHLQSYVLSVSLELLKFDNFTIKVHHHRDVLFHLTTAHPVADFSQLVHFMCIEHINITWSSNFFTRYCL
jgi:hypothetical protein